MTADRTPALLTDKALEGALKAHGHVLGEYEPAKVALRLYVEAFLAAQDREALVAHLAATAERTPEREIVRVTEDGMEPMGRETWLEVLDALLGPLPEPQSGD